MLAYVTCVEKELQAKVENLQAIFELTTATPEEVKFEEDEKVCVRDCVALM